MGGSERGEDESEVDFQIGSYEIDSDPIRFEGDESDDVESEVVQLGMEPQAVFRRLATEIYDSEESGIREPVTNAVTAVLKAQEEYGLEEKRGVIEIEVHRSSQSGKVVIQDNGVGITETELEKVLSVVGRSTNRNREDLGGQYGMGFLALWMLTGTNSGFVMHTHPRESGEEPISGVWKEGAFIKGPTEKFENSLSENEYGTRLELGLKPTIDPDDVRDWVEKYTEFCRVPCIYREFNENGKELTNEEYGDKTLEDGLPEDALAVKFENEHLKAVASDKPRGETLLLDVPIERNKNSIQNIPLSGVDIRLKKERAVIVDGPNEGKIPVPEDEYHEKPADEQEQYIIDTTLSADDVVMPGPTGTRDRLERRDEFWEWLADKLREQYYNRAGNILSNVNTTDELLSRPYEELKLISHFSDFTRPANSGSRVPEMQSIIDSYTDTHVTEDLAESVYALGESVRRLVWDGNSPIDHSIYNRVLACDVIQASVKGDVFMGVHINEDKAKIALKDSENNCVVKISNTEKYEVLGVLGWRKLQEITGSTVDEFDVDHSLKKLVGGYGKADSIEDRTLTVHFRSGSFGEKLTVGEIEDLIQESEGDDLVEVSDSKKFNRFVLFPSTIERNLSDSYWLTKSETAVATCPLKVWNYLQGFDRVYKADDYITDANEMVVTTSQGELTVEHLPKNTVIHVVKPSAIELFNNDEFFPRYEKFFVNHVYTGELYSVPDYDSITYVPVTPDTYRDIHPAGVDRKDGFHVVVGDADSPVSTESVRTDSKPYAHARLGGEIGGTPEFEQVIAGLSPIDEGGFDIVETLAKIVDTNEDVHSTLSDHPLSSGPN